MTGTKNRYGCALLLTGHEDAFSLERAVLRQAGVLRVRMLHSGKQGLALLTRQPGGEVFAAAQPGGKSHAAALSDGKSIAAAELPNGQGFTAAALLDQPIDFVVCTEKLSDMSGQAFLRDLFAACRVLDLALPPLLAVTSDPDSQAALLALGAGAVLVRPYAVAELGECLQRLKASAPQRRHTAQDYFRQSAASGQCPVADKQSEETMLATAVASDEVACTRGRVACGPTAILATAVASDEVALARPAATILTAAVVSDEVALIRAASGEASSREASSGEDLNSLNPLLHTRRGLALLRENRLEEAEPLLRLALERDSMDLEACLGLTRLCRQLGDEAGEERWHTRAAVICLRSGQPERAGIFLSRLPGDTAADPFMAEAHCLLQEEDYLGAAEAFMELQGSRPELPLHELAARASQFTDCPEETLRELCAAYRRKGQDLIARQLYNRLLAHSDEEAEPFERDANPGPFPVLHEVLAVMRFAASAWRLAS